MHLCKKSKLKPLLSSYGGPVGSGKKLFPKSRPMSVRRRFRDLHTNPASICSREKISGKKVIKSCCMEAKSSEGSSGKERTRCSSGFSYYTLDRWNISFCWGKGWVTKQCREKKVQSKAGCNHQLASYEMCYTSPLPGREAKLQPKLHVGVKVMSQVLPV